MGKSDKQQRANPKPRADTKRKRVSKSSYEAAMEPLEVELNNMARWAQATAHRIVVLLEGRDTAGKGGVISAITATLNPRQVRAVALPKPTDREQTQWYFQRYVQHMPAAGEIVLFDRSWYNRAGVERVMGYCTEEQAQTFLLQTPVFERMLVDDGILLFKYWLTVDQAQQEERFAERLEDPLKRWKLSPVDIKSRDHYAAYGQARDQMLAATHTPFAPWTLVNFNDQRLGRITLIRDLLSRLPDTHCPPPDIDLVPLDHAPLKEHFGHPLRPLKPARLK